MVKTIEVLDTIRDARQSSLINISLDSAVAMAKQSARFGSDYIELNYPLQSKNKGEDFIAAYKSLEGKVGNSKLVAFSATANPKEAVQDDEGLRAILETGVKTATLYGKTWKPHITEQLKISPKRNLEVIRDSISFLKSHGVDNLIYDAEHFFSGFLEDPTYAFATVKAAIEGGATRIVYCDTKGICDESLIKSVVNAIRTHLPDKGVIHGFHGHNDRRREVSNTETFVDEILAFNDTVHIQGTINGYGERTGNAPINIIVPNLHLQKKYDFPNINFADLTDISNEVAFIVGVRLDKNMPYVGDYAFAHKAGGHTDAILKIGPHAYNHIDPTIVGNKTRYILSDHAGRAGMVVFGRTYGYELSKEDPRVKKLAREADRLRAEGYDLNESDAVAKLFLMRFYEGRPPIMKVDEAKTISENIRGENTAIDEVIRSEIRNSYNNPLFSAGKCPSSKGPVDAQFNNLKEMFGRHYDVRNIDMRFFDINIKKLNGGHYSESAVATTVGFSDGKNKWLTLGVSTDIMESSRRAIINGFEYPIYTGLVAGRK